MLAEARSHATAAGLSAVDYVRATAEDLAEFALAPVQVVTFGQSVHRTNRLVVAGPATRLAGS